MNAIAKGAAVLLVILGTVFLCAAQDKLRRVERPSEYISANTPIEVAVNFDGTALPTREVHAGPDWVRRLSLEVTNTSGKDVRLVWIDLVLRKANFEAFRAGQRGPETASVVITVELPFSQPEVKILPPGGRVTLKPPISLVNHWTDYVLKQGIQDFEKVLLDIRRVAFTDGTTWEAGRIYRKDPETGRDIPIKPKTSPPADDPEDFKAQFPTALYNPPAISNIDDRLKREAKGSRYDNSRMLVFPDEPTNDEEGTTFFNETPARKQLPIKESSFIVIGSIIDSRAFLTNDKKNVYSEFTVRVEEVLKCPADQLPPKEIVVDRLGGYVRYPNGKKRLHLVNGLLMPRVDRKYLLFLANPDQSPNFEIVSGYELRNGKVFSLNPVDLLPTVASMDSVSLKVAVRREILSVESKSKPEER